MSRTWFSIDPGITGTGIAIWNKNTNCQNYENDKRLRLAYTVNIYPPNSETIRWIYRAEVVYDSIKLLFNKYAPIEVYCEFQEFFQDSSRGRAATVRGDITKLTYLTGMIGALCRERCIALILVKPAEWRGQLPDSVVKQRVISAIGEERTKELNIKSHSFDAVAIGLWAQKKF